MEKKRPYFREYATLKGRGAGEKKYTLTIHKSPVRMPGYEEEDPEKQEIKRLRARALKRSAKSAADEVINDRLEQSLSRSRSKVLQIASNNSWEYFVTLTLKRDSAEFDAYNLDSVQKKLTQFFRNYARRSGKGYGFKYLLIPERHEDGAIHFHGLMMGINPKDLYINENGYMDFKPYKDRFGHFSFGKGAKVEHQQAGEWLGDEFSGGKIRDLEATAKYITKYISKTMFMDGTTEGDLSGYYEPGANLYFCSKGLKRDELVFTGVSKYTAENFEQNGQTVYQNDFCAKVAMDSKEQGLECMEPHGRIRFYSGVNIQEPSRTAAARKKLRIYQWHRLIDLQKLQEREAFAQLVSKLKYDIMSDAELMEVQRMFSGDWKQEAL